MSAGRRSSGARRSSRSALDALQKEKVEDKPMEALSDASPNSDDSSDNYRVKGEGMFMFHTTRNVILMSQILNNVMILIYIFRIVLGKRVDEEIIVKPIGEDLSGESEESDDISNYYLI